MKSKLLTFAAAAILALTGFVSCKETVYPVAVLKFTLDKNQLKLGEGMETSLKVTIYPDNATNKDVAWASSDTSVLEIIPDIDRDRVTLKAKKKGVAQIKVNTITTYSKQYAYCDVIVTEFVPVDSLSFDTPHLEIVKGMTGNLTAMFHPENASERKVEWEWSGRGIGVVPGEDSSAVVKAFTVGKCWVYAYAINLGKKTGEPAKCEVDVIDSTHVTGVTLDKEELVLKDKQTGMLTVTIEPADATDKAVEWESLDTAIVSVEPTEVFGQANVIARHVGSAQVVVTSVDGGLTDTCLVVVDSLHVESIALNQKALQLERGLSTSLVATVMPLDATDPSVTWVSSDESKATVTADPEDSRKAIVTAVEAGDVTVRAITVDGGKEAVCNFTVIEELPDTVVLDIFFGDPSGVNPLGFALETPAAEDEDISFGETYNFLYKYNIGGADKEKQIPITICRGKESGARYSYKLISPDDAAYEGYTLLCDIKGEWFALPVFGGRYLSELMLSIGNGYAKTFGLSTTITETTSIGSISLPAGSKTTTGAGTVVKPGTKTVKFYTNGNDGGLTPATATTEISTPYFLHVTANNGTRVNRIMMTYTKELPTR